MSKRVPGVYSKAGARNVFGVYGATKIDQSGQNPLIGRFPTNLIVHVMVSGVFPEAVSLRRNDTGHIVRSTWGHSGVSCQDGTSSASRYFKNLVK